MTGDGVTVVEMTISAGVEFNLTVVIDAGCDPPVRRNEPMIARS